MRLTIITINLNNNLGLQKTIESIRNQIFKDFEYIIVDGASTDGSIEIIKDCSTNLDISFSWLSESDSGVYEAMNKGIRKAKGEYLLFLNSGDFLVDKDVLNTVFSNPHKANFLLGSSYQSHLDKVIFTLVPPQRLTFGYIYTIGLSHQATFIKKKTFEKFGLYREDFKYNSDVDFWYKTIVLNACPTENLNVIISNYNLDGISSLNAKSKAFQDELIEILSNPVLQMFIPDYEFYINERKGMRILNWYKSKRYIYALLEFFYKLICKKTNWFKINRCFH